DSSRSPRAGIRKARPPRLCRSPPAPFVRASGPASVPFRRLAQAMGLSELSRSATNRATPARMTHPTPEGLAARRAALALLQAVLNHRRPLDEALESMPAIKALDPRDRAFARLLTATTLRRLGQVDALIDHAVTRGLPAAAGTVRDVLRLGVAQLLILETPPHAAVATSVDLVEAAG